MYLYKDEADALIRNAGSEVLSELKEKNKFMTSLLDEGD